MVFVMFLSISLQVHYPFQFPFLRPFPFNFPFPFCLPSLSLSISLSVSLRLSLSLSFSFYISHSLSLSLLLSLCLFLVSVPFLSSATFACAEHCLAGPLRVRERTQETETVWRRECKSKSRIAQIRRFINPLLEKTCVFTGF